MVIDLRVAAGMLAARQHLPNTPKSVLQAVVADIVELVDNLRTDEAELCSLTPDPGDGPKAA